MTKSHLLVLCLITQMTCGAFAQQTGTISPPPPPQKQTKEQQPQRPDDDEVVKITTNLVQVDAVVTDKDGKIVTDLKPDEVQIFEDGKPQRITHFAYNVTGTESANRAAMPLAAARVNEVAPPVVPERLKPENVHRTIAIVVDDLGLSFESIGLVRPALKKFVDEQVRPGDLVAIIRTGGSVGALQQFSSDKRQLYAAIERVKWNAMGRADTGPFPAIGRPDLPIPSEAPRRSQTAEAFREEVFSVGTLGTLSYVVRGLRDLPGRKSVLMLSDGFKVFDPGDPAGTHRVQTALDTLTDLANRASVVIYTMDARGPTPIGLQAQDHVELTSQRLAQDLRALQGLMAIRRDRFYESQNGLNYLAQQTGGIAIRNTNNLNGGIQRVLEDQRGYYLIGYRPDGSTFEDKSGRRKFHNLSLKVTRRGDFKVRMRNGFFGIRDEESKRAQKTTAEQLLSAITSPFGADGIHVQLTSLFGNDSANGSFMTSMLHLDARDLTFKDGPNNTREAVFDALAMTFGSNGEGVDYIARTFTLQLPEDLYQRAMRQGLVYNVTVPIKQPGAYQSRISLRDAGSDRIGSAGQFIEVPDLGRNRLVLSGLVLSGASIDSSSVSVAASPQNRAGTDQANPDASPAVRHFKQGMQLQYGYLIYNAQLDKATQKPKLTTELRLFRDGKQFFDGGERAFDAANQTDLKRLSASGALMLGTDLTPGEYVLQLVVTDALADKKYRTTTQWMDFEIVK